VNVEPLGLVRGEAADVYDGEFERAPIRRGAPRGAPLIEIIEAPEFASLTVIVVVDVPPA
jgi:hypothetical protein